MADNNLILSDEEAKFGTKALDVLQGFGGFLREMLGTTPEDFVGWLAGDWLKVRRATNMAEMLAKAREKIRARGVSEPQPVSLTIALPLLRAAADENRAELQEMWARLLANAMDPSRSGRVRQSFIEAVRQMEPVDALVLLKLSESPNWSPNPRDAFAQMFKRTPDEIEVSFRNLTRIELARIPDGGSRCELTAVGRALMLAIAD